MATEYRMQGGMDVIILNREGDVHNVEPIGVMYVGGFIMNVVALFRVHLFVVRRMDKIVVVFLAKVVRRGHLVRNVIKMDVVLTVFEDSIFEQLPFVV